eukprot:2162253-Lingulodinium_polyedra.AAC.1
MDVEFIDDRGNAGGDGPQVLADLGGGNAIVAAPDSAEARAEVSPALGKGAILQEFEDMLEAIFMDDGHLEPELAQ